MPMYINPTTGKKAELKDYSPLIAENPYEDGAVRYTGDGVVFSSAEDEEGKRQETYRKGDVGYIPYDAYSAYDAEVVDEALGTAEDTEAASNEEIIGQVWDEISGGYRDYMDEYGDYGESVVAEGEEAYADYASQAEAASGEYVSSLESLNTASNDKVDTYYDTAIAEQEQQVEDAMETLASRFSFSGFGRSTAHYEAQADLQEEAQQVIGSLNSERVAQKAYNDAMTAGATSEELDSLKEKLDAARANTTALKTSWMETMLGLEGQLTSAGMSNYEQFINALGMDTLSEEEQMQQLGYGYNPLTGEYQTLAGMTETDYGVGQISDALNDAIAQAELELMSQGMSQDEAQQEIENAMALAQLFGYDISGMLGTGTASTLDAQKLIASLSGGGGGGGGTGGSEYNEIYSYWNLMSSLGMDDDSIVADLLGQGATPTVLEEVQSARSAASYVATPDTSDEGGLIDWLGSIFSGGTPTAQAATGPGTVYGTTTGFTNPYSVFN